MENKKPNILQLNIYSCSLDDYGSGDNSIPEMFYTYLSDEEIEIALNEIEQNKFLSDHYSYYGERIVGFKSDELYKKLEEKGIFKIEKGFNFYTHYIEPYYDEDDLDNTNFEEIG